VPAYSDWYYYMVMNPEDRIRIVWIRPDPDPTGSWKNTRYLARPGSGSGSGSRSGAPLVFWFHFILIHCLYKMVREYYLLGYKYQNLTCKL